MPDKHVDVLRNPTDAKSFKMGSLLEPTTAAEEWKEVATKGMAAYRAPSLAQPHKARQALRDAYKGKIAPLLGFFLAYPNVPTARVVAQLGADIVWVDWEHGACSVETITDVSVDMFNSQKGSSGGHVWLTCEKI